MQEQRMQLRDTAVLPLSRKLYYRIKPLVPHMLRLWLRRRFIAVQYARSRAVWPIHEPAGAVPRNWEGWPGGKRFALVLTHDVESAAGNAQVPDLVRLELSLGFTSTFFFVPESYKNPERHFGLLRGHGFDIGVHGLQHDGKLFSSQEEFLRKASRINHYLQHWGASGFRAPSMHHNLAWQHSLNIDYDASTYDTDPFEPQGGGAGTIFPFRVADRATGHSYVEIPYTLPQDFLLFVLMRLTTINLWKRKLAWIAGQGGMVHFITHPDYMSFAANGSNPQKYPVALYRTMLQHIQETYAGQYWAASPKQIADYAQAVHRTDTAHGVDNEAEEIAFDRGSPS